MGTNTPLIKIRGNLIKLAKNIMSEGLSAAGAEIKVPRAEKQKAAIIVPKIREKLITSTPSRITVAKRIKEVTKRPNKAEAKISPKIIDQREIGEEINLSNVFICVSQGTMTGVMAETAKNKAMPNKPETRKINGASLLKEKEIKRKAGINNP